MIWVKLCGMRSTADVRAAEAAGASAVGFVTASGSVRRVSARQAAEFGEGCSLERFLVTEDEEPAALLEAAGLAGVSGVQPHGLHAEAAAAAAIEAGYRVLFPITIAGDVEVVEAPQGSIPIFDGVKPGSGERFEVSLLSALPPDFVVAGGLTPDNVGEVLEAFRPYGVDVSSGIESKSGVKDPILMRRFVEAVL